VARRPGPSSGVSGRRRPSTGTVNRDGDRRSSERQASGPSRVDVRGWLGGIRLSGFMAIMLTLVVLAAFVLVPTLGTYLDQRARVAALEQAVRIGAEQVAELEAERDRWNDPAYITTQARERLFYVSPGEVVYLVDNDLDETDIPLDQQPVSADVQASASDWLTRALRSVTEAGLAKTAVVDPADGSTPAPSDAPTDVPTPESTDGP